jgi:MFS family permease
MIDPVTEAVPPLGLPRYAALFRAPHVRRLVLSGLLARLPMGMIGLALLLLVRDSGGSYAAAGGVSGAYFIATAVGAPIAGRLVDRRGQTRILLPRAVIFPGLLAAVCVLAVVDAPLVSIGVGAAAAGALMPPVGASLRALWPRLFGDADLRAAAYALEASLQEIIFIAGPLLVAVLAATVSPVLALAVAAAAGGIGTMLIALAEPVLAWRPEERHAASILGALESRGVRTIVGLSACLGLGFGATEVAFPAFAEGHGGAELGSIPISLFAAGSLVGGLVAGARVTVAPLRLLRVSAGLLVLGLALPLLGWSLPSMAVLAFLAGLPIAPVVMAAYGLIDAVATRGTAAEAFAWISTAVFVGFSLGTTLGGLLIDAVGVRASLGLGTAGVALGALFVAVGPGLEPG